MIGEYFTYFVQPRTGWGKAFNTFWKGDMVDYYRQREGRIFKNQADAERALSVAQSRWREEQNKDSKETKTLEYKPE